MTCRPALLLAWLLASCSCGEEPPLPPADPARGLKVNRPEAAPGYVLFAPLRSRSTFLIDSEGRVRHRWESPLSPLSVYLLDDGTLLRAGRVVENRTFDRGGRSGKIQRLAPDGNVLWEFELCDDQHSLHHDFEPLPNGNVLAIAWERLDHEDAVALGREPAKVRASGWWPDMVIEVRPTPPRGGEIVWEWRSREHLVQDLDPSKPNHGVVADRPERIDVNAERHGPPPQSEAERLRQERELAELRELGYAGGEEDGPPAGTAGTDPGAGREHRSDDWLHLNSVDYDAQHDLVLLSTPELAEIWIIDHSTTTEEARGSTGGRYGKGGDLLYRWGNPRIYDAGLLADQQLFFQHQPEWVPPGMPGAGNVTIFNNGMQRPGGVYSSVDEIVLPFDARIGFHREPGKPFGPEEPVWSYSDPPGFYSFFISGAHRLANGNTFVCQGKQGRLFEVTPGKEVVWEYWNPFGGELERVFSQGGRDLTIATSCFRATKVAPDHPGLRALGIAE
jgi:hypothetical protein